MPTGIQGQGLNGSNQLGVAGFGSGALARVKGALGTAATAVGRSIKQTLGVVDKAVIEVADFSGREIVKADAKKPAQAGGLGGFGSFSPDLIGDYAQKIQTAARKASAALGGNNGAAPQFVDKNNYKVYRFEVPFNPNELTITGYGGEEMAIQSFSNAELHGNGDKQGSKGGRPSNHIGAAKSYIELNIPLIFDKVSNADAFYGDKFNLGATNVAKTGASFIKTGVNENSYSVQPEVEALTQIIRSSDMRLMRFTWGDMSYEGILNSVNAEYQMFNVNGQPIRASVNLRMVLLDAEDYPSTSKTWVEKYKNRFGYDAAQAAIGGIGMLDIH